MWKIPIRNMITPVLSSTNRFDRVGEHELMQVVMHGSDTDMKFRSKVRGRVKASAQQRLPHSVLTLCRFRIRMDAHSLSPSFVPHKTSLSPKHADMLPV